MDIFGTFGSIATIVIVVVVVLVVLIILRVTTIFTVRTQENVILERFGKFVRVAKPGLNFKFPVIDSTTRAISLRVQQLEVNIETKTKDNVFVTVPVAVQYRIPEENVRDAYYRLSDPTAQIRSYVFDVVRSALSGLNLDEAFESKDDIAGSVERTLSDQMREYGFVIANTLVTDISPDQRVRDSMNSINAAQRDRVAAQSLAEADKIKRVTQAEAEAEAKRLQGVGVAAQRKAIAEGIAEQYEMLRRAGIEGTAEQLLLMTQYFDTLQDISRNARSNVMLLPSNPGATGNMFEEIRNSLLQSQGAAPVFAQAERDGEEYTAEEGRQARAARSTQPSRQQGGPQSGQQQGGAQSGRQQQSQGGTGLPSGLPDEAQAFVDRARGVAERFTNRAQDRRG